MIKKALRAWAAQCVFFGHIWRISKGGPSVGAVLHPEVDAYDVPRFLYWQLDCITENYAHQQEMEVLKALEERVFARERTSWLSVFVTSFIYLAILELDNWNLESWKVKSTRWAVDERVQHNPV